MKAFSMTGILDRPEAAGLIERQGNPADGRSIQILLSEQGRTLAGEAVRSIVEANREFLDILTKREQEELRGLIRQLRDRAGRG